MEYEASMETYVPLPEKQFDVTNHAQSILFFINCPCMGYMTQTLLLDDQEATLKTKTWLSKHTTRRPYAQLGAVEKRATCGTCNLIVTDLVPQPPPGAEEDGPQGLMPGCFGCDEAYVDQIVAELQDRKLKRGSVAQRMKLEYMYNKTVKVASQLPEMLGQVGVPYTPATPPVAVPPVVFPNKSWDITPACACCCPANLHLTQEEAWIQQSGVESVNQKREYAQLNNVQMVKQCFCCRAVSSDLGFISPGWGCSNQKVTEITDELTTRMYAKGTIGQIKIQENTLKQLVEIQKEIELLERHFGIKYPPSQDTMLKLYGTSVNVPAAIPASQLDQQVSTKTYNITNQCSNVCGCLCTCGMAGCTKSTLELLANEARVTETNNCGTLDMKIPYAQFGSIDHTKACCCCYSVNTSQAIVDPGCGCSKALVEEITAELHDRKVKRGNIAQIKQLEWMQSTAVELDIKSDLLLKEKGMAFPPSPELAGAIYGAHVPRIVHQPSRPPHLEASAPFAQKEYNITNYCESASIALCTLCLAGPTTKKITLEPEEVYVVTENCLYRVGDRQPYAQLGSVDTEEVCCGICTMVQSGDSIVNPGCGCSKALVAEIAAELQERKVKRGNIGQLKIQDNIMQEILKLSVKIDMLMHHVGGKK